MSWYYDSHHEMIAIASLYLDLSLPLPMIELVAHFVSLPFSPPSRSHSIMKTNVFHIFNGCGRFMCGWMQN